MKEDILEQIASDYLNLRGYFTQTNIKYRPDKSEPDWNGRQDGVHSDIEDVRLRTASMASDVLAEGHAQLASFRGEYHSALSDLQEGKYEHHRQRNGKGHVLSC